MIGNRRSDILNLIINHYIQTGEPMGSKTLCQLLPYSVSSATIRNEMAALGVSYERPRGGVYIWCRLPDGVDSKRFINRAYNMGLILIPGYVFYPFKNGGRNYVRINYSYESDERLLAGMEVFRAALLESLEG